MRNRPQINTDFIEIQKPAADHIQMGVVAPPNSPANSPKKFSQNNFFQAPPQDKPEPQTPSQIKAPSPNA